MGTRSHSKRAATWLQKSWLATIALVEGGEGRVTLTEAQLLMGHVPGGCQPRRDFF